MLLFLLFLVAAICACLLWERSCCCCEHARARISGGAIFFVSAHSDAPSFRARSRSHAETAAFDVDAPDNGEEPHYFANFPYPYMVRVALSVVLFCVSVVTTRRDCVLPRMVVFISVTRLRS